MKIFGINVVVFTILFGLIYFFATTSGAPGASDQDIGMLRAVGGVLVAILAFSFWMTMLIDCLSSEKPRNKVVWGLSLVFLSWFAAILYFIFVYRKPNSAAKNS